ncbi:LytR/AlgR family response regulator transcription factor [Rubrivirga sp. IMCC45206]|uniref:LytR/AlgR family response regulator transcription factor n=1 Tax=Rubrivirga sp. IMCC45206 TaxID=3391614 RepID=UPI00398FE9C2
MPPDDRPLRGLIVEDSPVSRAVLEGYVARHSGVTLVASVADPAGAASALDAHAVDLVFLDIELGDESGLAIARRLAPGVQLVVTTAREQYAIDSVHFRAADFLLKPIGYRRFAEAVDRARRLAGLRPTTP